MRALLISSPWGALRGTDNDVESIARFLEDQGFILSLCCGSDATQEGIRNAWQKFIHDIFMDDGVDIPAVIYFSGHGGEIKSEGNSTQQFRHQFIVPTDYKSIPNNFRGILDMELSSLLRDTTNVTHNVTVILDCCHSGRMARDPRHGKSAVPKNVPVARGIDVQKHIQKLRQDGYIKGDYSMEGNPYVVRIAAAAASETAWEDDSVNGEKVQKVGVLTEALLLAMREAGDRTLPWRTLILRVKELVNVRFPRQHPQVDGRQNRIPLSLTEVDSTELLIKLENDIPKIQAGHVGGVFKGSIYSIMPFGTQPSDSSRQIAEATVDDVTGFRSTVSLAFKNGNRTLPTDGALAFLEREALYKWPVVIPSNLPTLRTRLEQSKFLKDHSSDTDSTELAKYSRDGQQIVLVNNCGVRVACHEFRGDIPPMHTVVAAVKSAEKLARAQHLLRLKSESRQEQLTHKLYYELGLMKNGVPGRVILPNGRDFVTEDSHVYVHLHNLDPQSKVFVSVFDVEINGNISSVSSSPTGIELIPTEPYTIETRADGKLGLPISWPVNVPKLQSVEETLVLVITNEPVDLQYLVTPEGQKSADGRTASQHSQLETLVRSLSYGELRGVGSERTGTGVLYDVVQIPFLIEPKRHPTLTSIQQQLSSVELDNSDSHRLGNEEWEESTQRLLADLPEPEDTQEWQLIQDLNVAPLEGGAAPKV